MNGAWLENVQLTGPSQLFFGLFSAPDADWKHMRDVWEWSHVLRAGLAARSFLSMSRAIAH